MCTLEHVFYHGPFWGVFKSCLQPSRIISIKLLIIVNIRSVTTSVNVLFNDVCFCLNYFAILDMYSFTFRFVWFVTPLCLATHVLVVYELYLVLLIMCVGLRISNLFCWLHVSRFNLMHVHLHLLNHLKIC